MLTCREKIIKKSVYYHLDNKYPFIIISASKNENSELKNSQNTDNLKRALMINPTLFPYQPVNGGYINDRNNVVNKKSFIVYSQKNEEDIKALYIFGSKLAKRYNQDYIYFSDGSGYRLYIDCKKNIIDLKDMGSMDLVNYLKDDKEGKNDDKVKENSFIANIKTDNDVIIYNETNEDLMISLNLGACIQPSTKLIRETYGKNGLIGYTQLICQEH